MVAMGAGMREGQKKESGATALSQKCGDAFWQEPFRHEDEISEKNAGTCTYSQSETDLTIIPT